MLATIEEIDLSVFRRYVGLSLPRHVSYPMPTGWHDLEAADAQAMLRESRQGAGCNDLSLYLHVPFCERLCRFCACTRVIQKKTAPGATDRTSRYVAAVETEIRRLGERVGDRNHVRQIHWGGGTPTYLPIEQFERLHGAIEEVFQILPDAEIAIEIDPRVTTVPILEALRRMGFNRVSLGVQDFDAQVQEHVHRVQPFEMVENTVEACRKLGFDSVNFDLIYGLPYQTPDTLRDTIEKTIELSPDRIAFYHYAQIPEKIATQRGMDYTKLPDSETKLEMFLTGLRMFRSGGYMFIGLDHFAKPDEPLAVAMREGRLQRNFQGMTTGGGLDLIGLGASSISHLAGIGFGQNVHDTDEYIACMEEGGSPIRRGKRLTFDDRVRQAVISQLYCTAEIQTAGIEEEFDVVFADYFSREMEIMKELQDEGLVIVTGDGGVLVTLPLGRVLMRNVAGVFDAYLEPDAYRVGDRRCFSANA
ncbi:MAG: oxygen-independent coproporphyrinogen III oxidase [Phycisphaerae bacterium]